MKDDQINFWVSDDCGWIRVSGEASHLNANQVKEFAKRVRGRGIHELIVDLEECSGLDSTFMGTLAGIALKLRELRHGSVRLANLHPEQEKQFRDLGLDKLFFQ